MKSLVTLFSAVGLVLIFSGCDASSGVADRIQEKSAAFAQLTPEQKKNIEGRVIEMSYTTDMVYMALGKPSNRVTKETPEGPVEMWTYRNFYAPQGFAKVGDATQQYRADKEPGAQVEHEVGGKKAIAATRGGVQSNLFLPELESDTLYVQFFQGRVFSIKLDSQN